MDLNLITDVKFNKITKFDDDELVCSYDGVTWETPRSISPSPFFMTELNFGFSIGNSINTYIDFEFTDAQSIYNIDFDYSVGSCVLKYQYSFDGVNYLDFDYFKIDVGNDSKYYNTIFRKHSSGDKYRYSVYDVTDVSSEEYQTIKSIIENETNTPTQRQIFSITESDIIKYLYTDIHIKHLRIVFNNMDTSTTAFKFLSLDVLSKKVFSSLSDVYDVSFIKHHLYRQKYFADYTFIPSITDTFLKMLSNKE